MTLRDDLLPLVYEIRSIPGLFGIRPHTVEIGLQTWSGPHTGDGTKTIKWTPVVEGNGQSPKVRWLTEEELAVGGLDNGTIEVGPITPDFPGGGTSVATIRGVSLAVGGQLQLRITGPMHPTGAIYEVTKRDFGRAIHYTLQAKPVSINTDFAVVIPTTAWTDETGTPWVDEFAEDWTSS